MDAMRVCLLNDSFPPVIDGVANVVVNYATILQSKCARVVVGTPQYPGVVDDYPFQVIRYPSIDTTKLIGYRAGYPFNAYALNDLKGDGLDIIHSHCPVASTLLARALREATNTPVIFTYHTKFDIDIAKAIEAHWLQAAAIKALASNISAADEVWVVSQGAGKNLQKLGYQGSYRIMENGVDFPRGRASLEEISALRKQLQLTDNVPIFLFVGRMMWYKGIRLILDALDMLHRDGRRFHMLFVGDGQDRSEIDAYTEQLDLRSVCTFTGAIRDRELLRGYFSLCNLFVFPSTFDTNGIVVREAAACGAPSLLIRGSCAAEGITDRKTGLFCEENAGSLAATLAQVMEQPQLLRQIGQDAMDNIYISWEDAVHSAYLRYGQVVEKYRGTGHVHSERPGNLFSLAADISEALKRAEENRLQHGRPPRRLRGSGSEDNDRS